jgi:hypothetical protein
MESSQSTEGKIGTRLSFLSADRLLTAPTEQKPVSLSEICFDFVPCLVTAQRGAIESASVNPLTGTDSSSSGGFVRLPSQPKLDLPSKIRRQDTFGDEFYESWDRNVAVGVGEEDLNGNISLGPSRATGGDCDESETSDEEEQTTSAITARNEIERWKQMALELQDQVIHLRATGRAEAGKDVEEEQRKRKKLRRGQRLHEALAEEQAQASESASQETKEVVEEPPRKQQQSPSPAPSPRQSKALPPKKKPAKLRKS